MSPAVLPDVTKGTYHDLLNAVQWYYGEGSDQWYKMASGSATMAERAQILKQVPGVSTTVNSKGELIGWDYSYPFSENYNPVTSVDSNIPNSSYGAVNNPEAVSKPFEGKINGTVETSGGGTSTLGSGAKTVSTGTKVMTVASTISWATLAASLGCKLGKAINSNFGGQYAWDESDWEDWVSGMDPLDQSVFRALFGIDGDNTTMYLPEDMLASMYLTLLRSGAYATGDGEATITNTSLLYDSSRKQPVLFSINATGQVVVNSQRNLTDTFTAEKTSGDADVYFVSGLPNASSVSFNRLAISSKPFTVHAQDLESTGEIRASGNYSGIARTNKAGETIYLIAWTYNTRWGVGNIVESVPSIYVTHQLGDNSQEGKDIATIILDGTRAIPSPIEGMEDDPRASTQIDPSNISGTTPQTVLPQLKQNYPQLFGDAIYEDVLQDDGSTKTITYLPIPFPTKDEQGKPITGIPSQDNPQVDPDTDTDTLIDTLIDTITQLLNPTPPATGDGDSPTTVTPVGSASSLWKIYNPTQAQLDSFGAWLWDSTFVEQIKKLFNDPMQAIIGVHKVFASPSIGGSATIKVGYLDSQVASDWVDNQYTTIDCGTVNVREYFGNVFDYAPYTRISLYLPFIGIVDLDVADVMRGSVSVVYHVDVLTGACLADVIIKRDSAGGVIYQYSGSAIVTYPVSSGNYMGMVAGVLSVAGGIAGTILSGGALAPALVGGAVGMSHLHTDVGKSGGFSGCAGAMGAKKPYLIISRPQTRMAGNFEHFTGLPANSHVTLSSCSGFTRVKSVYVKTTKKSTDEEKAMIEAQLKKGVLI